MENTITGTIELIDKIAGRAQKRTVDESDLYQVLAEAQSDVWGMRAGSTVANNYKYPASRMRLVAVRKSDGDYAVWCDWGSANNGSSAIPAALPRQRRLNNNDFGKILRRVADGVDSLNETTMPDALLKSSDVNRLLHQQRQEARQKAAAGIIWTNPDWNGRIIRQDSISAGNCERETNKVTSKMRVSRFTTASHLREWITRYAPTLSRYADKAIEKARERQLVTA
jgi:hypothetical protein